jgi:HSP20 family protein
MNSLIRWDPFKDLDRFFADIYENFFPALLPTVKISSNPVDIYEKDNKLFVDIALPGLSKEDIKIKIKDNYLIVKAGKEEKEEEKKKNYYYRKEIKTGVERVIALPYKVNEKEAKAEFNNGILRISFPQENIKEETEIKID